MERNLDGLDFEADSTYDQGEFDDPGAKSSLIAKDAISRIDRIKAMLNAPRGKLGDDKRWVQIAGALRFASRIAAPNYIKQYQDRKVVWIELLRARLNLRELLAAGMITRTEERLVMYQTGRLWKIIDDTPVFTIETRYRSRHMPWSRWKPRENGLRARLSDNPNPWVDKDLGPWLELLSKASGSDQVSPMVLKEVLSHIKRVCMGPDPEDTLMQDLLESHPEGVLGDEPEPEDDDDQSPLDSLFNLDPEDIQVDDELQQGEK